MIDSDDDEPMVDSDDDKPILDSDDDEPIYDIDKDVLFVNTEINKFARFYSYEW